MQKKNQVFASQQGSAVITEVGLTNLTADASEDRCATRPHALTSACSASEGFAGPQRDIYTPGKPKLNPLLRTYRREWKEKNLEQRLG